MVQWTMLDLRNAISPNCATRALWQALRSFRPGCQDPGPGRPPGTTSREDIPGRPGVYTHTPNSTVFSTISTKYRAGPRSGSRVSAPGAVVAARRLRRARVRPLPSPAAVWGRSVVAQAAQGGWWLRVGPMPAGGGGRFSSPQPVRFDPVLICQGAPNRGLTQELTSWLFQVIAYYEGVLPADVLESTMVDMASETGGAAGGGAASAPAAGARKVGDTYTPAKFMPACLLYTSPSPRDKRQSRMPSSA